jgi:predicted DNA-binding transcriptional regulator YafY
MDAAFAQTSRSDEPQIAPGTLLELATACRRGERARLSYRDLRGRATVRDVDPYRLVHTGHRWYFVARDVAKGEWRTFRADRVTQIQPTGQPVEIVDPPDPALFVAQGGGTTADSLARYLLGLGVQVSVLPRRRTGGIATPHPRVARSQPRIS